MTKPLRVGVVGGGPGALFLYQAIVESRLNATVELFEQSSELGRGMPYSRRGAGKEHVTNVSGNEIPPLPESLVDWLQTLSREHLSSFGLEKERINEFKVLPRLLFGEYLAAQFDTLLSRGTQRGITTEVRHHAPVRDISYDAKNGEAVIHLDAQQEHRFDAVVVCTGHVWTTSSEGKVDNYFDSPYPPQKLTGERDHPVAIRGTSLTAIDAVRTIARENGAFVRTGESRSLRYEPHPSVPNFRIIMHSREGFLPGIRFHLEDPRLKKREGLSDKEIDEHRSKNGGFISLDYLFDKEFKESFRSADPRFFERIKSLTLEAFVDSMTREREVSDPFDYFKEEYDQALESIQNDESIHWKEKLAILSFTLNRRAKYFCAEDMIRLQKTLMPLISVVIAFVPQSSCDELFALHAAGRLELRAVGDDSEIEPKHSGGIVYHYGSSSKSARFETFIDCIGQQPLSFEQFPFAGLRRKGNVSAARAVFASLQEAERNIQAGNEKVEIEGGVAYLTLPGISIGDDFEVIDQNGSPNRRLYVIAVPLIAGHNPDYSGLDFCEDAGKRVAASLHKIKPLSDP